MNNIIFFKIASNDLINMLYIALIAIIVTYGNAFKERKKQFYSKPNPLTRFAKRNFKRFVLSFIIIITPIILLLAVSHYINYKKEIILSLNDIHISIHHNDTLTKISWDYIDIIYLKDYDEKLPETLLMKRNVIKKRHHHIYFINKYLPLLGFVDLHAIDESSHDLFKEIRKFYKGTILKEYKKGTFKILTDQISPKGKLVWQNISLDQDLYRLIKISLNSFFK